MDVYVVRAHADIVRGLEAQAAISKLNVDSLSFRTMGESHCPICYGALDIRDVAPCFDCGHDSKELEHLAEGRHTYAEMRGFGIHVVLCNFCQVDFSSYDPTYFGRTAGTRPDREMTFARDALNPSPAKDKYCPGCGHRLAFLRFLAEARAETTD